MPIEWSVEPATRLVRVRLAGVSSEADYLALVRGVAMVNLTGDLDILVDATALETAPEFPSIVKIGREVWLHRSVNPDRFAVIGGENRAIFGKARQFVSVLASLGLRAEVFPDATSAFAWLDRSAR